MKSSIHRIVTTLSVLALSTSAAYAATAVCQCRVIEVGNHVPGGVYVRVADAGITKICDLNVAYGRVTPADCRQDLATAQLAFATAKQVSMWLDNAPTTACASVPSWSVGMDLRYFGLI